MLYVTPISIMLDRWKCYIRCFTLKRKQYNLNIRQWAWQSTLVKKQVNFKLPISRLYRNYLPYVPKRIEKHLYLLAYFYKFRDYNVSFHLLYVLIENLFILGQKILHK